MHILVEALYCNPVAFRILDSNADIAVKAQQPEVIDWSLTDVSQPQSRKSKREGRFSTLIVLLTSFISRALLLIMR